MSEPLRPLSFGPLIDAAARLVYQHPTTLVGLAALPFLVFVPALPLSFALPGTAGAPVNTQGLDPWLPAIAVGGLIMLLLVSVLWPVAIAALPYAGAEARLGRTPRFADAARLGWRLLMPIGWVLTLILLLVIGVLLLFGIAVWVVADFSSAAAGGLGAVGVIALGYLVLRLTLVLPVVVLEQRRGAAALDRSAALMRGQEWRALGIFLVLNLAIAVVGGVLSAGLGPVPAVGAALGMLAQIVVQAVGTALNAAVTLLLYLDIRVRGEGLDLEQLAAQVTQAATGTA